MERREAQRPASLAARTPIAAIPGNGDIAVSAQAGRKVRPAGLVSLLLKGGASALAPPGAPSPHGEKEKGKDGRRTSLNNRRAERWLFVIAGPPRSGVTRQSIFFKDDGCAGQARA